ncbi:MAG: hypothetical protein KF893_22795 [Caldilineaceae bacterium]|nr:hypothetical protein [Caldilineaceae bacterium]
MSDMMVTLLLGLMILGVLTLIWFARSVRTVPEGYVAILQWMDKHSRVVGSGPYLLRPLEEEVSQLFVRRREVRSLGIPNIFTHGGIPLTVMLDYEMRLAPKRMAQDEIYYDETEREDQQIRILKGILLDLVRSLPQPPTSQDTNRQDFASLFSPFVTHAAQIRGMLEQRAIADLAGHGVEVSEGSLLISWLKIPDAIVSAYTDALALGFSGAAQHELIQRLRNAGANMSDMALIQLVNAIKDNPGQLNTIFTSGGFQPDLRVQMGNATVQVPGTPATQGTPPSAPDPSQGGTQSSNGAANMPAGDLPLTPADMALLRSVVE